LIHCLGACDLPRDLRDQIDDIADRARGLAEPIHGQACFLRGGAGLIGKLAGVAHLGPDCSRGMGEVFRHLRKAANLKMRPASSQSRVKSWLMVAS